MARPRAEQPTPAELAILQVLWGRDGPATVREILDEVNRGEETPRAYTSVMSLMNVMAEKGLLRRSPRGRAFAYEPAEPRDQTLRSFLSETLERVYRGSASLLVAHLLDQSAPSADELERIRALLDGYEDRSGPTGEGGDPCRPSRPKRPRPRG